jgi:hypothetical protein
MSLVTYKMNDLFKLDTAVSDRRESNPSPVSVKDHVKEVLGDL